MCGITGYRDLEQRTSLDDHRRVVTGMTTRLHHRGPDSGDVWVDAPDGIALGHRRLAIVDLSPEGYQPMHSADGRYVMVYNGEVYNFPGLRAELEFLGHRFRGTSDTEVMLAAICQWGVEAAVARFNGMFAFALWDRRDRRLYLVRDRVGIKPLYYGWLGPNFAFGSELKALRAHPAFTADIDRDALAVYLRHNYIPAPLTIYRGIHKLPPGHILTLTEAGDVHLMAYWSAQAVAQAGVDHPFTGSEADAVDLLNELLLDAVGIRMIADVPLGAFLSGGVDSSAVVALMQARSHQPVKTFTIGFHDVQYNEAENAREVARHLGTDHTELYVTEQDALDVIPRLPALFDEPFSDSSQIPTYLVSELTRRYVTVSLSGDGGDELFAGYSRYLDTMRTWQASQRWPQVARTMLRGGVTAFSEAQWSQFFGAVGPLLPPEKRRNLFGERLYGLADTLNFRSPQALYRQRVSHWKDPDRLVIDGHEPLTAHADPERWLQNTAFIPWMQALDMDTYLVDDILVKVDRASMGVSLEARVPLLDYRVVELAWSLPLSMKIRDGQSKWILRQVLYRYIPAELIERPKTGFGIPIHKWLRGDLRDWAESLLDERRLREEGYFHPEPIRRKWRQLLDDDRDWGYYLWDILVFQAWLEAQGATEARVRADASWGLDG